MRWIKFARREIPIEMITGIEYSIYNGVKINIKEDNVTYFFEEENEKVKLEKIILFYQELLAEIHSDKEIVNAKEIYSKYYPTPENGKMVWLHQRHRGDYNVTYLDAMIKIEILESLPDDCNFFGTPKEYLDKGIITYPEQEYKNFYRLSEIDWEKTKELDEEK
jgi:hypothetical protein